MMKIPTVKSEEICKFFMHKMKENPSFFDRSQLPNQTTPRKKIMSGIAKDFHQRYQKKITFKQITKKLANMKWRVRQKYLKFGKGSDSVNWAQWELDLLAMCGGGRTGYDKSMDMLPFRSLEMSGMEMPPQFAFKKEEVVEVKQEKVEFPEEDTLEYPTAHNEQSDTDQSLTVTVPSPEATLEPDMEMVIEPDCGRTAADILNGYETTETMNMDATELQRLILLKQNMVLSIKLEKMKKYNHMDQSY